MILSDNGAARNVIGCLMLNPLLFLEYPDIIATDFDNTVIRICFVTIKSLYEQGARILTPIEVDQEIEIHTNSYIIYQKENGLDLLKTAYNFANLDNFELSYTRLKKYALLRTLKKEHYDISEFYIDDKDIDDPLAAVKIQDHFEQSSLEDILNSVEKRYTVIRNEFLSGKKLQSDPAEGIFSLIENLKESPNVGPSLEGEIFSTACRGARAGCFFLKSASTNAGKSRTSIFDACRLAYPVRWSHEQGTFVEEIYKATGEFRQPRKVLFIVTEMDKEELQTIMLAYLSGVDEDHILTGTYPEFEEYSRVKYAAHIIQKYSGYFIIEEISDPNLVNIEATIKKYATVDNVSYVFFDYIHTTASMVNQFTKNGLREDVILMLMANQLKQIAKDYNLFIFSATQVNSTAMMDDGEFKNEASIRGSKAVADKADMGYVMTRISEKFWNSITPALRTAARSGIIDSTIFEDPNNKPTHVLDIYKMRRGRYKNVRIWVNLHLGTGRRKDLFMTTADNQPIPGIVTLFSSIAEKPINFWRDELKK